MFSWEIYEFFRSSHRRCFMRQAVHKKISQYLKKNKIHKKRLQHRCFPLNIGKFIKEHLLSAASDFFKAGFPLVGFFRKKRLFSRREFLKMENIKKTPQIKSKAVVQRCSVNKVFLEISPNSQENTCAGVSFKIKLQPSGLQLY